MKIIYSILIIVIIVFGGSYLLSRKDVSDTNSLSDEIAQTIETLDSTEFKIQTKTKSTEVQVHTALTDPTVVLPLRAPNGDIPARTSSGAGTSSQVEQGGDLVKYTKSADLTNLSGTNILFFKASWCPTCAALYKALVAEESAIPTGVTIWVVDYDTNKEMRIKYGVTTQHTLVQIDTELNKTNLWRGGYSLSEVMSNVK